MDEIAKFLRCSKTVAKRLCEEKKIPAFRIGSMHYADSERLSAYINSLNGDRLWTPKSEHERSGRRIDEKWKNAPGAGHKKRDDVFLASVTKVENKSDTNKNFLSVLKD